MSTQSGGGPETAKNRPQDPWGLETGPFPLNPGQKTAAGAPGLPKNRDPYGFFGKKAINPQAQLAPIETGRKLP
jgi:hypothetical protein